MKEKCKSSEFIREINKKNHDFEEKNLKHYAALSKNAIRKNKYIQKSHFGSENELDLRPAFCRDADRIIHSLSFSRFSDKTQVFFWIDSDVFQHRLLHVQLVAKISRFIARILGLNEDLAESISLGHDIGHSPFGHDGEMVLSELCLKNKIGHFHHNYESLWFLQEIEMQNLTLQTLDGILCHNGELHEPTLKPKLNSLSWEQLEEEMKSLLFTTSNREQLKPKPKTMEGALVRYVDTISYISRDIRDAEYLNLISFRELPSNVRKTLGTSNRAIINTLINDLIKNSINRDCISYGGDVANALSELYDFNLERIYLHPRKKNSRQFLDQSFSKLWEIFVRDLEDKNMKSEIYRDHFVFNINDIKTRYPQIQTLTDYPYFNNCSKDPNIIVRDFLAGMTDGYFLKLVRKYIPELKFHREKI